ncbi:MULTISPECIES: MFS transporter [Thermus]|uniref:Major Facilitator Superfamily protein n=1 Tax=Thermus brockianus TaxID=56956 RepID=A0A1J0LU77_THEBO|nr:MFS transporter [Thermus brockianus]APD09910.1 Major Facilitator Superfamily protein [Thermus brockianus]
MKGISPAYRFVLASFLWSFGANLVYFFLNFHLQALGYTRAHIGYAQALLLLMGVVSALPLAYLIPRLGYLKSLYLAFFLAAGSGLLLGLGLLVFPALGGYGLAGALLQGAAAPLMARLVPPERRVALFSLQAALTTASGFFSTLLAGLLSEWVGARHVLLFALPFFLLAVPLALGLPEGEGKTPRLGGRFGVWLRLLVPQVVIGFGAGLVIPFLNLYLKEKFGLTYGATGLVFALSSLATGGAMLLQPLLVHRVGKLKAIVLVQALSLPFLALLAWAPWLPVVTFALLVRGALMNAAGPVYAALVMDYLPEEERPGFFLVESALWSLLFALGSALSGKLQAALGLPAFHYLFGATLALYALGIALWPWAFGRLKALYEA